MHSELKQRVEKALDQVRPFLQKDGGDVQLLEITPENDVKLELLGACRTCSMSMMTMKAGIEETIKRSVPEINKIEAIGVMA
jgi:Fe-S cluster biogenesis protein NfuA